MRSIRDRPQRNGRRITKATQEKGPTRMERVARRLPCRAIPAVPKVQHQPQALRIRRARRGVALRILRMNEAVTYDEALTYVHYAGRSFGFLFSDYLFTSNRSSTPHWRGSPP